MKLGSIEKDKQPSQEILRLFEKTRVAYLSAAQDPDEYGGRWRNAVDTIIESYEELDAAGKELKNFIDEKDLNDKDTKDPTTRQAKELYENIKLLRYSSSIVADPFSDMFKGNVLEELLDNPESMVKFVHYALRDDNKALPESILAVKGMQADTITEGLVGLDLESEDIALYIIEHYGDGKDSKKVEAKVKAAMDMLELIYFSKHEEKDWEDLKDIEGMKKSVEKDEKKSISHFIVPNKPMYRIFEIEDINKLKGFSGDWYVQEKYDGMRIQLHKLDGKVKIYSFNEKDISEKCIAQVKELEKKEYGDCILDGELVLFDGDDPLHRADTIAHVFKGKYKDATLKCHVFDIIRHESQTLTDEELENRMTILFNNYASKSSQAISFPSKKDTRQADSLEDVEKYAKEMMDIPTSEGVVIKDATSTYYIGTKKNPKWIKWKKFVDLDVIVLEKKKTKSNLYSYTVGIGPIIEEMDGLVEVNKTKYLNVGKALNTKIAVDIGDIIRVKVDEVKKKGDGYSLFSAKVIEIPEVEHPDKLVTLELLSQDTKKSLNYDVTALEKGVRVTDHIHGKADVIIKYDLDVFTIYGFEENNLMSRNATADLDMWKQQAIDIMKSKQSELTVAIFQYLKENGPQRVSKVHNFLKEKHKELYEDILESDSKKLKKWSVQRDGISEFENRLKADEDKIMQEEEIKKSFFLKNVKLIEEAQELEEEITIDSNTDMEGECCSNLKLGYISIIENSLEELIAEYGSYENFINRANESLRASYAPTFEEEMKEMEGGVLDVSCEEIVEHLREIFEKHRFSDIKQLLDEYEQCQFGEGFSDKFAMLKAYKTPKKLQKGLFKLYAREDNNVTLAIQVGDENMFWTIDLENDEEMFDLFGAAGKYPAEVSKNIERGKVIDSGKIRLGVQRDGYHEYFLEGNKFETKMHIRVIKVEGQEMWLAWTGYKQEPADTEGDKGKWNIYEDRYNKLSIPTNE